MPKVKYVHVVRLDGYRKFIVLYDDGTWEELFRFHWTNPQKIDGKLFLRKTRDEAFDLAIQLLEI